MRPAGRIEQIRRRNTLVRMGGAAGSRGRRRAALSTCGAPGSCDRELGHAEPPAPATWARAASDLNCLELARRQGLVQTRRNFGRRLARLPNSPSRPEAVPARAPNMSCVDPVKATKLDRSRAVSTFSRGCVRERRRRHGGSYNGEGSVSGPGIGQLYFNAYRRQILDPEKPNRQKLGRGVNRQRPPDPPYFALGNSCRPLLIRAI